MLRPNPRIIQAGRHRMRMHHLTIAAQHHIRFRPMQNPHLAAVQWCTMLPGIQPLTSRFHTNEPHLLIRQIFGKRPNGVRTPTNTRHHHIRQPAGALQHLLPGLLRNNLLELLHQLRERVRAGGRPQQIVGGVQALHPIPQRHINSIRQCLTVLVRNRHHLRPHQPHPIHIRLLPGHIPRPHINGALHTHERRNHGGGHTMLPRTGLGNKPGLAHALRQ